jgi:hypothetical protein
MKTKPAPPSGTRWVGPIRWEPAERAEQPANECVCGGTRFGYQCQLHGYRGVADNNLFEIWARNGEYSTWGGRALHVEGDRVWVAVPLRVSWLAGQVAAAGGTDGTHWQERSSLQNAGEWGYTVAHQGMDITVVYGGRGEFSLHNPPYKRGSRAYRALVESLWPKGIPHPSNFTGW